MPIGEIFEVFSFLLLKERIKRIRREPKRNTKLSTRYKYTAIYITTNCTKDILEFQPMCGGESWTSLFE